jgi:hypothetical protein
MAISERPSAILTSVRRPWGGFVVLLTRSACPRTNSTEVRKSETKVTGIRQILYALRTKGFVVRKLAYIPLIEKYSAYPPKGAKFLP